MPWLAKELWPEESVVMTLCILGCPAAIWLDPLDCFPSYDGSSRETVRDIKLPGDNGSSQEKSNS